MTEKQAQQAKKFTDKYFTDTPDMMTKWVWNKGYGCLKVVLFIGLFKFISATTYFAFCAWWACSELTAIRSK